MHIWNMSDGSRVKSIKMSDLYKTHPTITAMAFSHKYRLYMLITSEFKMLFINELHNIVTTLDMSAVRLINFAHFNDKQDQVIIAGIEGVNIYKFRYISKYQPRLAANIDQEGKYIEI